MAAIKIKERGLAELRPFRSAMEFEQTSGVRLLMPFYFRMLQWDPRVYAYAPYLGYVTWVDETKLILGYKQFSLSTLFNCYEYSLDGKDWRPFGTKK